MDIQKIDESYADILAPLVADFRVILRSYKGVVSKPDVKAGREEVIDFLKCRYPIFVAKDAGKCVGYIVCRIEESLLWVEQLYVCGDYRRKGIASLLFKEAEEIAHSMGEDTVFNYVHPNNNGVIRFLRSKGYTVLNLIEIHKPYQGEKLTTTIQVDNHSFDY